MNAFEIISELEQAGVQLWEEGGHLRFRAPKGALTEARRATIANHRAMLIEALRAPTGTVEPDPGSYHQPFPLTDVQAAYLFGRHADFGGVACHMYVEIVLGESDPVAVEWAWNALIQRHAMLRAVIDPNGSQRVLEQVPHYPIALCGTSLTEVRQEMGHRMRDPARWPLFELRLTPMVGNAILHLSVDFLIADWASIRILLGELEQLRRAPGSALAPLELSFRDYVLAERRNRESMRYQRDRAYWLARIDELAPAPQLPLALERSNTEEAAAARFRRWTMRMAPAHWSGLRSLAAANGVTPSTAVLAAYAEVLDTWSRQRRFTLNLTLLNRLPIHPGVDSIVGDFTSVNLLAVDNDRNTGFGERAKALSAQLFDDLDHRLFSGVEVIREIARRRGRDAALMPVVFTSAIGLNVAGAESDAADLPEIGWGITQTPQVWIDCQAMDWQGELMVNWDIREGVLADGIAEDMFGAFSQLLERLANDSSAWQRKVPLTLPMEQVQHRRSANDTAAPLPSGLLHDQVFVTALRSPQRCALVSGPRAFSYAELTGYAAAVAFELGRFACRPGERVAVLMDKGWEQVVAVLGVLCAGAAWLPIDTNQPAARREQMLGDAGVRIVLTQSWLLDEVSRTPGRSTVAIDTLAPLEAPGALPKTPVSPDDLAYVIYTSGSTGKPKGVMVSHASALNTIVDVNRRFGVSGDDRVFGLANLGFDLSVFDIFGPLSVGGCLVLPDAARRSNPSHWADLIARHQVTLWNSVPAQLQMLEHYLAGAPDQALPSLRLALLSGDWIPLGLPQEVRRHIPQLELVSLGGATEAAIWSIFQPIRSAPETKLGSIPYGRPLANQQFHVFGEGWRPCPELVAGELYISGAGLAIGYLGDAEQTAERFLTHPDTCERLYRTGDLGRYLRDGSIEFLGREDDQVKIRGNRVELAEVEAALKTHPAVGEVAVIVAGDERLNRRLVAFVAPRSGKAGQGVAAPESEVLEAHAALLLPPYMIPGRIQIVPELPLSANGKVDRQALRLMAGAMPAKEAQGGEEPRSDLERRLARIWAEVLELPVVGREQDFFRLGGDSLRAARLVGRVRESVPEAAGLFFDSLVRQLLPSPTIAALAAYLEAQRSLGQAETVPVRSSPALVRLGGSTLGAGPARILVHDGTGRLAAYRELVPYWEEQPEVEQSTGPLLGLTVTEAGSYLHPGPAALLERRATSYARQLQSHGQRSVQLAGRGFGALLALELARQLIEMGVDVLAMTLLDPRALSHPIEDTELDALFELEMGGVPAWPKIDQISDEAVLRRMFADTVRASSVQTASPYLGDVTLLRSDAGAHFGGIDWGALILGELRQVTLGATPAEATLAPLVFDLVHSPRTLQ